MILLKSISKKVSLEIISEIEFTRLNWMSQLYIFVQLHEPIYSVGRYMQRSSSRICPSNNSIGDGNDDNIGKCDGHSN